ncbi:glycosyltransferase family 2 protein [Alysiella filiformis]|uniref:Glycosyltransferase involved in cell wall bisynthesis n=1 Tax=Alysiella filiformis DSM 16848 TaxID=1120981 RepID=A0A286E9A1_9NEIS|nr:glycosyltransferase family 2 protein [Alysiella filiformis]QMT31442.1 glycosyltransferase family 2 protein [Alysiella filiformis]UBQ55547.1 glycosyltransferase family 2 protein [Alysiella filiformis DSM 16848]SOD67460.1 Glycosyltransferase involved in cell wall bisynthesis [Alysiella filiformis DSM 16848]
MSFTVALIITTYNRPDALAHVLQSAMQQSRLPDEIIIADDGSDERTAQVIQAAAKQSPMPLHHAWQPDDGFRAAQSRNRALALAKCDYIIMIDGDMLLHPEFVADHLRIAKKGFWVQGSRVLLTEDLTAEILAQPLPNPCVISGSHAGVLKKHATWRLPFLSRYWARCLGKSKKSVKTCNLAVFREDALRINGFNNEFVGWGREDDEFAARLQHAGMQRANLRWAGVAYHLWHKESDRAALPRNEALLSQTLSQKLTRCENGVDVFLQK